jgi:hypothetical protein
MSYHLPSSFFDYDFFLVNFCIKTPAREFNQGYIQHEGKINKKVLDWRSVVILW